MSVNASCNLLRMRTCADTLLLLVDIFSGLAAGASSSSYRSVKFRVVLQMLFFHFRENSKLREILFSLKFSQKLFKFMIK
jgi:hypothetical protein